MKICFLFGSGADSSFSKKLKSGNDFNEALLTDKYKTQRKIVLDNNTVSVPFVHHNSKKIFAQTIYYNRKEAVKIFGNEIVDECCDYYESNKPASETLTKFFNKSYQSIKDTTSNIKYRNFYLKNAQFFDSLDEKFNALRFPNNFNNSAKRVINAYWTIFFLMLNWLFDVDFDELELGEIVDLVNKEYQIEEEPNNYYRLLRDSEIDCSIVTTNYTDIAERITEKNVTYLHGNLKWFEDISNLTILDKKEDILNIDSKKLIPFILIPSGIKPLICKKQVEQFYELIEKLDESNEMCIIGYRFNSEDNHINSIIREWLNKKDSHITIFDYGNDINLNSFAWLSDYHSNGMIIEESSSQILKTKLFWQGKITKINNSNLDDFIDVFKEYLTELKSTQ